MHRKPTRQSVDFRSEKTPVSRDNSAMPAATRQMSCWALQQPWQQGEFSEFMAATESLAGRCSGPAKKSVEQIFWSGKRSAP